MKQYSTERTSRCKCRTSLRTTNLIVRLRTLTIGASLGRAEIRASARAARAARRAYFAEASRNAASEPRPGDDRSRDGGGGGGGSGGDDATNGGDAVAKKGFWGRLLRLAGKAGRPANAPLADDVEAPPVSSSAAAAAAATLVDDELRVSPCRSPTKESSTKGSPRAAISLPCGRSVQSAAVHTLPLLEGSSAAGLDGSYGGNDDDDNDDYGAGANAVVCADADAGVGAGVGPRVSPVQGHTGGRKGGRTVTGAQTEAEAEAQAQAEVQAEARREAREAAKCAAKRANAVGSLVAAAQSQNRDDLSAALAASKVEAM